MPNPTTPPEGTRWTAPGEGATLAAHATAAAVVTDRLAPSEIVYLAENPARVAYAVVSGTLAEYRIREDGREWIVRLLRPGGVFGLEALREGAGYGYTVEALTATEIVPFRPAEVPETLLVGALEGQREETRRRMEALMTQPLRARVAVFVLGDAERAGSGGAFALSVTQRTLAAHEVTTQSHIAEALRKLSDAGAIRMVGPRNQTQIVVSDVRKLRAEAARESGS